MAGERQQRQLVVAKAHSAHSAHSALDGSGKDGDTHDRRSRRNWLSSAWEFEWSTQDAIRDSG